MAASTSASSLKEYLKRYGTEDENKKKKKKIKKQKADLLGVLVVDEDPVWQKPVKVGEEEDDSAGMIFIAVFLDEEKPQINEDVEVKRMKRLEQIRSQRPYHAISEDGSGWIPISDAPEPTTRRVRYDTPSPESELNPRSSVNEDLDLSPPRQQRKRFHTPSPERDSDLSPPRRVPAQSSDLSPPRKSRKASGISESPDLSPPRRINCSSPKADNSHNLTTDLSPPRKSRKVSSSLKEEKRSGLFTAQEIKKEVNRTKKKELSRFKGMDPSMTGRDAKPIYRDKEGKRTTKEELQKSQGEEKPKEKKLEWGQGLAQKREVEAREQELELEKDKPFARTRGFPIDLLRIVEEGLSGKFHFRDDPELENMLKERVRWGDPMAHLVKRKHSELLLEDLGDNEKMKESGFNIPQEIPFHSWINRKVDAPPNRYAIKPGRHWDGIDRSNGMLTSLLMLVSENFYSIV
ncbi:hypothetical protein GIB67_037693 [Kingdonia uniflora]|uniref:BUD13 homolog n=1 Tax=Kingdonia uniflora TaxID=39325 RepID=A0A7J7MGE4_9MAGN|nr:hypothetical protein GIB67_037693 [Kingdonia uniflora]